MANISIYTDGACSGNPGKGGLGFVILADGIVKAKGSAGYRHTTNNRMEILAVTKALEALKDVLSTLGENSRETDIKVTVYSDSQLVVNTMTQGWGRKSNLDLWKGLDKALEQYGRIEFVKVKGHADDRYNNMADELAVKGTTNATNTDEAYEKISSAQKEEQGRLFQQREQVSHEQPTIINVHFYGYDKPEGRRVEIDLSNGTVVTIVPLHGGFEQTGCTTEEARVTVGLAWKYNKWLNGAK